MMYTHYISAQLHQPTIPSTHQKPKVAHVVDRPRQYSQPRDSKYFTHLQPRDSN